MEAVNVTFSIVLYPVEAVRNIVLIHAYITITTYVDLCHSMRLT